MFRASYSLSKTLNLCSGSKALVLETLQHKPKAEGLGHKETLLTADAPGIRLLPTGAVSLCTSGITSASGLHLNYHSSSRYRE